MVLADPTPLPLICKSAANTLGVIKDNATPTDPILAAILFIIIFHLLSPKKKQPLAYLGRHYTLIVASGCGQQLNSNHTKGYVKSLSTQSESIKCGIERINFRSITNSFCSKIGEKQV